ncbi:virion core protein [Hypsugopox virus]|nr:virion core protein [Hypsugopox virus]
MENEIIYINNYNCPSIKKLNNEFYLVFNNNDFFINNVIKTLFSYKLFFTEYEIYPNNKGTLYLKLINSSIKINNRFLNVEEFIQSNYNINYYNTKLKITILKSIDKLIISDIVYLDNNIWKRIIIIQSPSIIDKSYERYLVNPFLALSQDEYIFKNIMLISIINNLFNDDNSTCKKLLNEIVKSHTLNKIIVLINNKNVYDSKYINYCYNRNKIKAFIYAWFSNQLVINDKENEKVEKVYQSLNSLI